ncbi:hypothetical protein [Pseudomonas fortuita]|uniref:hypothetical protein n=1 Tax=Pseudomonas fortuita TaxID=3233375 RepID=UPI003C2BCFA0
MSIDKDKLKALADRVLNERRFCVDEHHRELAEGVQALLAEVGFLLESRAEARADRDGIGDRYDAASIECDQLKADNEALRSAAMAAGEFIMHEAEVRGLLDENGQVSHRHPRRQQAIARIEAALGRGVPHG